MAWLIWIGLAIVLGMLEMLTVDLTFLMLAGGALFGAVPAALGASFTVQIIVALIFAVVFYVFLRPLARKRMFNRMPSDTFNVGALPGKQAVVEQEVSDSGGLIKLVGEVWSARAAKPGEVYGPGESVVVIHIDGAIAVVKKID